MPGEILEHEIEDITKKRRINGGWEKVTTTVAEQLQIIKEREETYGNWDKEEPFNEYNPD